MSFDPAANFQAALNLHRIRQEREERREQLQREQEDRERLFQERQRERSSRDFFALAKLQVENPSVDATKLSAGFGGSLDASQTEALREVRKLSRRQSELSQLAGLATGPRTSPVAVPTGTARAGPPSGLPTVRGGPVVPGSTTIPGVTPGRTRVEEFPGSLVEFNRSVQSIANDPEALNELGRRIRQSEQAGLVLDQKEAVDRIKMMREIEQDQIANEDTLRADFTRLSKDTIARVDAFRRIQEASRDPSAAGDFSLIFAFGKMVDPGSVFREGEQAALRNAAGAIAGLQGKIDQLLTNLATGSPAPVLTPAIRADLVNRSQRLLKPALEQQKELDQQFTSIARRRNLRPENVILDFRGNLKGRKLPDPPTREQLAALGIEEEFVVDPSFVGFDPKTGNPLFQMPDAIGTVIEVTPD